MINNFERALDEGIRYLLGSDVFDDGGLARKATYSQGILADISPTDDGYELKAEIPGMAEDAIDVKYEKNVITIAVDYGEEGNGLRKGKFTFRGRLDDIDSSKISAKLKDGILTIELPKVEETKARKISITT